MIEHRLIERMVALMRDRLEGLKAGAEPDTDFIERASDFLAVYADRCHHGKEEDILFRDLRDKDLTHEHRRVMDGLVSDHQFARAQKRAMLAASRRFAAGEQGAADEVRESLEALVNLYPDHIATEDDEFFPAAMAYLTQDEQAAMLEEFREFDRQLIHETHKAIVEAMEQDA